MSLAQHRFVEGFIKRCSVLGIQSPDTVVSLLKFAAKDALDATEAVYKKMGKSPMEHQSNPSLVGDEGQNTGTSAYEESRDFATSHPAQT